MRSSMMIWLISAILLINFAGEVCADDWPMFRHDIEHHGYTEELAPDEGELIWRHHVDETWYGVISSPAVVDGVVYFGSDDGNVSALNAVNGKIVWKVQTSNSPVRSSPAVDPLNDLLVINSEVVNGLYLSNGTEKWSFDTEENWEFSSPLIFDGVVYIGSYDGRIYALNETNGQELWSYNTHDAPRSPNFNGGNGGIGSSPATDGSRIFFGCTDNVFYAINITTHDIDWKYEFGDRIHAGPVDYPFGTGPDSFCSPAVDLSAGDHGIVYVGADDGIMYAFDIEADDDGWDNDLDGVTDNEAILIWDTDVGGRIVSSPAVHGENIFFGVFESGIDNFYCLNKEDGNDEWSHMFDDAVWSSPAVADGIVVTGSEDHTVTAFNETDGLVIWQYETGAQVPSCPAIYDEVVYVGSVDYYLYALGIPTNQPDAAVFPDDLILPTTVYEDDKVDITCTVHNIGNENITSLDVEITIDDDLIHSENIAIEFGKNHEITVEWDAVLGDHMVNLTLSNCQPNEREMDNNMVSKVIEVKEKQPHNPGEDWTFVDFTIEDITMVPVDPEEDDEITATVEVNNIGNGTGEGTITIYIDEETSQNELYENDITHNPDHTESYSTTYTAELGDHTFIAILECHNDTDNTSNRKVLDFTVTERFQEPKADLNITKVEMKVDGVPVQNLTDGDFVIIEVTVENEGDRDTQAEIIIYDGDPSLNQRIGYLKISIRSGVSKLLMFSWPVVEGNYIVNIVVTSSVEDGDETNNEYTVTVNVGPKMDDGDDDDDDFIPVYPASILIAVITATGIHWKKQRK